MAAESTTQPASRLAAQLARSVEVRRVEQRRPGRALVYTTNNGLRSRETRTIREFGWQIQSVHPRHNMVTVVWQTRRDSGGDA